MAGDAWVRATADGHADVLIDAGIRGPQIGVRADQRLRVDERSDCDDEVGRIHIDPGRAVIVREAVLPVTDGDRRIGQARHDRVRQRGQRARPGRVLGGDLKRIGAVVLEIGHHLGGRGRVEGGARNRRSVLEPADLVGRDRRSAIVRWGLPLEGDAVASRLGQDALRLTRRRRVGDGQREIVKEEAAGTDGIRRPGALHVRELQLVGLEKGSHVKAEGGVAVDDAPVLAEFPAGLRRAGE